ncbi:MAG TPA: CDP-diacylglycerol--glycerol-3-phosphate 3-phosphatidyltransferase [Candidatus Ozemobacteraceae bacterium]|nr:CDP-diacylglycerol--glycerol-3-phosphate 3-phosphatidyltransferase [Candidatus Ozemobacteraceae bacterium]
MTLATKLTFLRVAAIPVFLVSFLWRGPDQLAGDWGKVIATATFIFAAITDYYDGAVARWYKEETTFGKFIDPIADKLLVSTALIAMVEYRALTFTPAWVAIVIIAREFAVTGLRLICTPKGMAIEASNLGKWKTTAQLTAIITALVFISARVIMDSWQYTNAAATFAVYHGPIIQVLMGIAVLMTVYSGYDYLKRNWHLLHE